MGAPIVGVAPNLRTELLLGMAWQADRLRWLGKPLTAPQMFFEAAFGVRPQSS